jgi:hypothetical protein
LDRQVTERISGYTRFVLTLDLVFSLTAGTVLYVLSTHTERLFAWTIKLPVTATFLGAGYFGAVVVLLITFRTFVWPRARSLPVVGFVLTGTTLLVTLWHLEQFHLGKGGAFARIAGWTWLVVYIVVPILLASAFVREERRQPRVGPAEPLVPLTRAALAVLTVPMAVIGLGLVFWPSAFDVVWPWPLPPLSAGAVGAWLLTIATIAGWALHEGDWVRLRPWLLGLLAFVALIVIGTIRYSAPIDFGEWQEWAFFGTIALSVAAFSASAWQQERRRPEAVAEAQPA